MLAFRITFRLLVILTVICYTHQQEKDPAFMKMYYGYTADCAKENGLEVDYVNGVWSQTHFPNDSKLKCHFKCMALKLGMMNEKGDVVDDVLKSVSAQFENASTDREIVEECGAIQGTDLCETAYALMACIRSAELD